MKIIIDNRIQARFKYPLTLTCMSCKSVLEAEESDVKEQPAEERVPSYAYVKCPLCDFKNSVKPEPIRTL